MARTACWALRQFDEIIAVSAPIARELRLHLPEQTISVVPAFLPVTGTIAAGLDEELDCFLSKPGTTLLASASRVTFTQDGRDLYGLDAATNAFVTLAKDRPDLRLAIFHALPPASRRARNHLTRLTAVLSAAGLQDRVRWAYGLDLPAAFCHNVVLVRPTLSDGDSVSVREALAAGVPVVASDVTSRPPGTRTYRTLSADSLESALAETLTDRVGRTYAGSATGPVPGDAGTSNLRRLLEIYICHLGETSAHDSQRHADARGRPRVAGGR